MTSSAETPTFRIERRPLELRFRWTTLTAREWLTPEYVRVRLTGDDLVGFTSLGADDHIRVFFPDGETSTVEELRSSPSREYTPLAWDADEGWLDLEFAVHGDQGVGAPWAAHAPLGSPAGVGGPRGSAVMAGRPDAWFLAGDETAVPAMRRFVGLMDADAVGRILIEVAGPDRELPLQNLPAGVSVSFVHRGDGPSGTALAATLDGIGADERPDGAAFGFVAAEQAIVKSGRALLRERWMLPAEQIVVKGYWKRGEAEYHAPH